METAIKILEIQRKEVERFSQMNKHELIQEIFKLKMAISFQDKFIEDYIEPVFRAKFNIMQEEINIFEKQIKKGRFKIITGDHDDDE
jgi:bifunctional DNase/RNase